jgi:hypothetical protein
MATKGFHPDTQLMLYLGGMKSAKHINRGDVLMGDDSSARIVTKVITSSDMMFRITPEYTEHFIVSASHVLIMYNEFTDKVIDMPLSEYMDQPDTWKLKHKMYCVPVDYDAQDVKNDPYLVGILLSSKTDSIDGTVKEYLTRRLDNLASFVNGLSDAKSLTKVDIDKDEIEYLLNHRYIPDNYLYNTRENRHKLLRGFIESNKQRQKSMMETAAPKRSLSAGRSSMMEAKPSLQVKRRSETPSMSKSGSSRRPSSISDIGSRASSRASSRSSCASNVSHTSHTSSVSSKKGSAPVSKPVTFRPSTKISTKPKAALRRGTPAVQPSTVHVDMDQINAEYTAKTETGDSTKAPSTIKEQIDQFMQLESKIKAVTKPVAKTTTKTTTKIATKTATKVSTKTTTKSPARPVTKQTTKVSTKTTTKSPARPVTKSPARSVTKSPARPVTKSPARPVTKSPARAPSRPTTPSKQVTGHKSRLAEFRDQIPALADQNTRLVVKDRILGEQVKFLARTLGFKSMYISEELWIFDPIVQLPPMKHKIETNFHVTQLVPGDSFGFESDGNGHILLASCLVTNN